MSGSSLGGKLRVMNLLRQLLLILTAAVLVCGCSGKQYPADSSGIKYANRSSPGAKLEVRKYLEPERMNLVYFYADW